MKINAKRAQIVAILGQKAAEDLEQADDADMIEMRLDLSPNPLQTIKEVRSTTEKPIIATNRMQAEGGRFQGSESERIRLLLEAADYADLVDIELEAALRDEFMQEVNRPVIISYHDFQGMPKRYELEAILQRMEMSGAAIGKIAVTPKSLEDCLAALGLLLDARMPLCLIAMGSLGRHLRAVAPLYGSALTYGYISESTAPGQLSLAELCLARRLFGW